MLKTVDMSFTSCSAAFWRLVADLSRTGEGVKVDSLETFRACRKARKNDLFRKIEHAVMKNPGCGTLLSFSALPGDARKLPKFLIAPSSVVNIFKAGAESRLAYLPAHHAVRLRLRMNSRNMA